MNSIEINNRELVDVLLQSDSKTADELLSYLKEKYNLPANLEKAIEKKIVQFFLPTFRNKYKSCLSITTKFLQKNDSWLKSKFSASETLLSRVRRTKSFDECSEKSKKRRVDELKSVILNNDVDATENVEKLNKETLIHVVKESISEQKDGTILAMQDTKKGEIEKDNCLLFTDDEALSLFMDLKLNKNPYELLRKRLREKQVDVLPAYKRITGGKTYCYPPNSAVEITDKGASLKLQDLLDHTATRILKIESVNPPETTTNLKLRVKYGCDGTSGLNPYKYRAENNENLSSSLFMMSLVPISLQFSDESITLWQNLRTSSPKSCWPISFHFMPETKESIVIELQKIENQIKRLKEGLIEFNNKIYKIIYELMCTMIDGKVCQAITGTSSASNCTICGAKPSEMNNLKKVRANEENLDAFQFGLQTLHAWIRFMECILHIAYKLPFKQWQAKTDEQKAVVEARKHHIQDELRKHIDIILDVVKQGTGSSNDGNTGRRFFENFDIVAKVTGVNKDLIKNLYIILQVLACGKAVDTDKFEKFASKTAEIYVKSYSWYYMPASLHKILVHGAKIIKSLVVPIGQLSEEAQESRNKDFKKFREANTRKSSLTNTNEDLLHFLLVPADPYLNSLRSEFSVNEKPLLPEAKELLLNNLDLPSDF